MAISSEFPSQHTGLQQSLFQKSIQVNEKNRKQKGQAQSEFIQQTKQSVDVLDSRLRYNAASYLANIPINDSIEKLRIDARQVAERLRDQAANQHKIRLEQAETDKRSVKLNIKEEKLVLEWSEIDKERLNISQTKILQTNSPQTLEECAQQALKMRQKMNELGHPSQYGSGAFGRSAGEIAWDTLKGMWIVLGGIFYFLVIQPFLADDIQAGIAKSFGIILAFLLIAWGASVWLELPFLSMLLILPGSLLCLGGLIGGIDGFSSQEEIEALEKERRSKRDQLRAGYSAYLIYHRAAAWMQGLYEKRIAQLEEQKNSEYAEVKRQENAMLNGIDQFAAQLRRAEIAFQETSQKIVAEFQQEQQALKHEYENLFEKLTPYSQLAIAAWSDEFWQNAFAQALADAKVKPGRCAGEIRIGKTVYPGNNSHRKMLPMLLDLDQCGHVFVFATYETDAQATKLLKAITARTVFAMPPGNAKFIFIDTKASGVFAEYGQLPEKMGNYVHSLSPEIQNQTQLLEQHQKRMQAQTGNNNWETLKSTAATPEPYRILCLTGFPNPKRFGPESESHLENIIQSGAKAGIHVVAKVNIDSGEANQNSIDPELYFKHGVVLRPAKQPGQWNVCFQEKIFPFTPDDAPDEFIFENLLRQINMLHSSTPKTRPMQVFLCHAVEDKTLVRTVYEKLKAESWLVAWLDEEELLPGQDWELEIEKALHNSAAVVVFLSNESVVKEGYLHKELKRVMDLYDQKPEGTIYLIPLRLDACDVPYRLKSKKIQWVDYFPPERRDEKFQALRKALEKRYQTRPVTHEKVQE